MLSKVVVALALLVGAEAFVSPRTLPRVSALASTGPSLDYNPDKYKDESNAGNFRKLSSALTDGDIERKKAEEEAFARENALEFARQERDRKIKFMVDMPEDTNAGIVIPLPHLLPPHLCRIRIAAPGVFFNEILTNI